MPTLTDKTKLDALREKCAGMDGTPSEIAAELNDATVEVVRSVSTDDFLEAVSPGAYSVILTVGNDPAHEYHADAAWLLQALDAGQVTATEGSRGRAVLVVLINSGVLSQAETEALIAAATTTTQEGQSWAEANGFGTVHPDNVRQVL